MSSAGPRRCIDKFFDFLELGLQNRMKAKMGKTTEADRSLQFQLLLNRTKTAQVLYKAGGAGGQGVTLYEPPAEFLCAITRECMVDPVIAPDGFSYERSAIERWFRAKRTSPQTNAPLASTALVPNIALRGLIEGFHEGR